jgi:hypothetical protein
MSAPYPPRSGIKPTSEYSGGRERFTLKIDHQAQELSPDASYAEAFNYYADDRNQTWVAALLLSGGYDDYEQQWDLVHQAAVEHQHAQALVLNETRERFQSITTLFMQNTVEEING